MALLLAPSLINLVDAANRRNVLCCIGASRSGSISLKAEGRKPSGDRLLDATPDGLRRSACMEARQMGQRPPVRSH